MNLKNLVLSTVCFILVFSFSIGGVKAQTVVDSSAASTKTLIDQITTELSTLTSTQLASVKKYVLDMKKPKYNITGVYSHGLPVAQKAKNKNMLAIGVNSTIEVENNSVNSTNRKNFKVVLNNKEVAWSQLWDTTSLTFMVPKDTPVGTYDLYLSGAIGMTNKVPVQIKKTEQFLPTVQLVSNKSTVGKKEIKVEWKEINMPKGVKGELFFRKKSDIKWSFSVGFVTTGATNSVVLKHSKVSMDKLTSGEYVLGFFIDGIWTNKSTDAEFGIFPWTITPAKPTAVISLENPFASESAYLSSTTLELGATDDFVVAIQAYLNANGYVVNEEIGGPGSVGYESNYFGEKTKQALIKFQLDKGISPAKGFFGPVTREAMGI